MPNELPDKSNEPVDLAKIEAEIVTAQSSRKKRVATKMFLAAIGSIPWVGGFLSAAAGLKGDEQTAKMDELQTQWLQAHQTKIEDLGSVFTSIEDRFEQIGPEIEERIQSEEYLSIVSQAFRTWDESDTAEKRRYAINLVVNAAGTRICSDDVVRLFLDWLELYHEVHFAVIRAVFGNPGITRYEIWIAIYGTALPREDSAEADLFKLMIRELSAGGVLRIERDTNALGQFVRRQPQRRRPTASTVLETAFEDTKPHVLTALGQQFVHYTMNEAITRIDSGKSASENS